MNDNVYTYIQRGLPFLFTLCLFLGATTAQAQLSVNFDIEEPKCGGFENGSVTALPSGGTPPYSYNWNTGATTQTITDIGAGTYMVTVSDNGGNQTIKNVIVSEPETLEATISSSGGCATSTTLTVSVSGGSAPYMHMWDTGDLGTTITVPGAGQYCVTVMDANTCGTIECITVEEGGNIDVNVQTTHISCPGEQDGSATATPIGGTAPYTYAWSNGGNTQTISGLAAGIYRVTITDTNGCTAEGSGLVSMPDPLNLQVSVINPTCVGENDGKAIATTMGGVAPYTYNWSTGATGMMLNNLSAGTYMVTVTDANGCQKMMTVSLMNQSNLSVDISASNNVCEGENNGSLTAIASNGVIPYSYAWSTGANTATISGLPTGTYTVTVTDGIGCSVVESSSIQTAAELIVDVIKEDIDCGGENTGNIIVSGWGGTPPYTYQWNTGAITPEISNLSAGSYTVTVTDSNGCTAVETITITEPPALIIQATSTDVTCEAASGTASVSASGGAAPYTYQWSNGATTATISGLAAGAYTVTVTDANGCRKITTVIVEENIFLLDIELHNESCPGAADGQITVSGWGGLPPYSYTWNTGQMNTGQSSTLSGLSAGRYTVTATDATGCEIIKTYTITAPPSLNVTITSNSPNCAGNASGSATAGVTGGTAPYTYLWSTGATTQTINGLTAGTYGVTVTDANGCTGTRTVSLSQPDDFIVDVAKQDVICFGQSNGSVLVSGWGGTPPYTYEWSTGLVETDTPDDLGSEARDLSAGTYTVTVTDANGCSIVESIEITEPPQLTGSISSNAPSCAGLSSGSATAAAMGGTAPYTYLWSTGATTQTITGLSAGTYTVRIQDANFCTINLTLSLSQPDDFIVDVAKQDVICFGQSNGSVLVSGWGGTPPYTYEWSTGLVETDTPDDLGSEARDLSAGTYTVTVTDANGCSIVETIEITEPPQLTGSISSNAPSCAGLSSGSATAAAMGGTAPYTYLWSTGATTQTITGLSAGTYTVRIQDANFCTINLTLSLSQPDDFIVDVAKQDVICFGQSNGSVLVSGWGGTPPYTYEWSTGLVETDTPDDLGSEARDLSAGTYTVTVTDANGCSIVETIEITEPPQLTGSISSNAPSCAGLSSGSATAAAMGGTAPYTYLWSTGATTQTITGLSAGTYTVRIQDANFCTINLTLSLSQPDDFIVDVAKQDVICFGQSNGSVLVSGWGGTPPYTYEWSTGLVETDTPDDLGSEARDLSAGTYTVTVTDANGCSIVESIEITEPPQLTGSISSNAPSCAGLSSGSATAAAMGGTAPYTYLWSTGATTQTITGLSAGTYTVRIQDANFCTINLTLSLSQPDDFIVDVAKQDVICFGQSNGSVLVSGWGGTPPYTYEWSTGLVETDTPDDLGSEARDLSAGTYTVTVTDANGCSIVESIEITEPPQLTGSISSNAPSCAGLSSGSATAAAMGGTAPYTYLWSTGATTQTITGLSAGTYTVRIQDANFCTINLTLSLSQPDDFIVDVAKQDVICFGQSNGSVLVSGWGGTPPYTYEWSTGLVETDTPDDLGSEARDLSAGTYTVTVTDANGCSIVETIEITEPPQLTATVTNNTPSCAGLSNGGASVQVSGGTSPYTYQWSNGATTATVENLAPGTYTVQIQDANFCTITRTITIAASPNIQLSMQVDNMECGETNTASITASVTGGVAPFTYAWSNGGTTQTISNLSAGTYTVTVTDTQGCSGTSTTSVSASPAPVCSIRIIQALSDSGSSDGILEANGSGGTAPYTFNWSNGASTARISGLSAGTYTVTITDANGCTSVCSATLESDCPMVMAGNGGQIGYDQILCGPGNDPEGLVNIEEPQWAEAGEELEYLWMYNLVLSNDMETWVAIPGSDTPSFDPGPLRQTTYFVRCVRRPGCPYIESNIVKIEVDDIAVAEIDIPNILCIGGNVTLYSAPNAQGATARWTVPNSTSPTAYGQNPLVRFTTPGQVTIRLEVTRNGCVSTDEKTVLLTDAPSICNPGLVIEADMLDDNIASVRWVMPTDLGEFTYIVERSPDGQNFEPVAEVTQAERTDFVNHFRYEDDSPKLGRNFYRVRYFKAQGNVHESNQEELVRKVKTHHVLYPNPAQDQVFVELVHEDQNSALVELYRADGQLISRTKVTDIDVRKKIDLSNLQQGIYFLKVRFENGDLDVSRLIKQ